MAYLASDIINAALRLIGGGTFAAGETPSTDETANGLQALNTLLESWSNEQLTVYQIKNFQQALAAATQTYTIGAGGTFNTPRPVKIQTPGIILSGIRHDLEMLSPAQWAAVPEKALTGQLPRGMWNDNAFPLATLYFTPIPSGTPTFDAYLWQALQQFATAGDSVSLPPAFFRALKYNLAVDLAPEYDRPVPDNVQALAASSKQDIVTLNTSNAVAKLPSDLPPPPDGQGQ